MVQWNDAVEEIPMPNYNETDGFWPDDSSNSSQSMDELVNGNGTLGQDETFFESLNDLALDEIAREVGSDKAFLDNMEDMPSSDGNTSYMAAGSGLLSSAVFVNAQAFFMRTISSLRNMSDDVGLDELVDVGDIKNAAA
jgi:hypothetical protein